MRYCPQSPIFREEFERQKRISQQSLEEHQRNINGFIDNIKRSENIINENKKKLEVYDEKKRGIIFNLRKIMEEWENHEEKLIYKPLKEEKQKLYQREMSKLQELTNDKIYEKYSNIMKKERENINENLKIIRKKEKIKENIQDHAIEMGRKTT